MLTRQDSRLVDHHDVVAAFISSASNRGQSRRVVAWSFALASRRGNAHQQCLSELQALREAVMPRAKAVAHYGRPDRLNIVRKHVIATGLHCARAACA
jgi:hypothetical protein